jgi:hypothetical protein
VSRIIVTFLRLILLAIIFYYLLKYVGRWIFAGSGKDSTVRRRSDEPDTRYKNLTDQAIDDADYEDIESGEKE